MNRRTRRPGLTLVELLIIVGALGLLAILVVPQFSSAEVDTREESLEAELARVRAALELYKRDHEHTYPPAASLAAALAGTPVSDTASTAASADGTTAIRYIDAIPVNPFTRTRTIGVGEVGTSAWFYDEQTGEFRANDSVEHRAF